MGGPYSRTGTARKWPYFDKKRQAGGAGLASACAENLGATIECLRRSRRLRNAAERQRVRTGRRSPDLIRS